MEPKFKNMCIRFSKRGVWSVSPGRFLESLLDVAFYYARVLETPSGSMVCRFVKVKHVRIRLKN